MSCEGQNVLSYDANTMYCKFAEHYELTGKDRQDLTPEVWQHHLIEAELLGIMFIGRFPKYRSRVNVVSNVLAFMRRESIRNHE